MEIILALMLLGATPFGAALLDKPTRKRFVKFAKSHASNSIFSKDEGGHITMAEALKLEPRNKDWKADTALQTLWQEAFNYWSIQDREATFKSALDKHMNYLAETDSLKKNVETYKESRLDSYSRTYYRLCAEMIAGLQSEIKARTDEYKNSLTTDEEKAITLHLKYGKEIYYHNDLIRLSAQKTLPRLDYVALTSYPSK